MITHKLVTELSGDEIARGTQAEMEKIHSAFTKYGLRKDKLIMLPVVPPPLPTQEPVGHEATCYHCDKPMYDWHLNSDNEWNDEQLCDEHWTERVATCPCGSCSDAREG